VTPVQVTYYATVNGESHKLSYPKSGCSCSNNSHALSVRFSSKLLSKNVCLFARYLAIGCIPRISLRGKVFVGPLPSNGCPIIESVIPGMCLPSLCLAMVMCVTYVKPLRAKFLLSLQRSVG
jgi:hypothetical protein